MQQARAVAARGSRFCERLFQVIAGHNRNNLEEIRCSVCWENIKNSDFTAACCRGQGLHLQCKLVWLNHGGATCPMCNQETPILTEEIRDAIDLIVSRIQSSKSLKDALEIVSENPTAARLILKRQESYLKGLELAFRYPSIALSTQKESIQIDPKKIKSAMRQLVENLEESVPLVIENYDHDERLVGAVEILRRNPRAAAEAVSIINFPENLHFSNIRRYARYEMYVFVMVTLANFFIPLDTQSSVCNAKDNLIISELLDPKINMLKIASFLAVVILATHEGIEAFFPAIAGIFISFALNIYALPLIADYRLDSFNNGLEVASNLVLLPLLIHDSFLLIKERGANEDAFLSLLINFFKVFFAVVLREVLTSSILMDRDSSYKSLSLLSCEIAHGYIPGCIWLAVIPALVGSVLFVISGRAVGDDLVGDILNRN